MCLFLGNFLLIHQLTRGRTGQHCYGYSFVSRYKNNADCESTLIQQFVLFKHTDLPDPQWDECKVSLIPNTVGRVCTCPVCHVGVALCPDLCYTARSEKLRQLEHRHAVSKCIKTARCRNIARVRVTCRNMLHTKRKNKQINEINFKLSEITGSD